MTVALVPLASASPVWRSIPPFTMTRKIIAVPAPSDVKATLWPTLPDCTRVYEPTADVSSVPITPHAHERMPSVESSAAVTAVVADTDALTPAVPPFTRIEGAVM